MRAFARLITKIIFKILFKVEVINLSKVPVEGSALVCANHNTILDMFFLGYKLKRWIHWMAKEELFRNPIAAYVLRKLGAFSIKRGRGDVSSIKNAYKLLEDGKLVGIFPHGTRIVSTNIEKAKVKPGAVMIAVNAGVPIIPATVSGSNKLFSKMRIIFGDPFYIENKEEIVTKEEIAELS